MCKLDLWKVPQMLDGSRYLREPYQSVERSMLIHIIRYVLNALLQSLVFLECLKDMGAEKSLMCYARE